jgi:hypothetical protein
MDNYVCRAQDLFHLKNPDKWDKESLFIKRKVDGNHQYGTIHKDFPLKVYFRVAFSAPFFLIYDSAEDILNDKWELNGS